MSETERELLAAIYRAPEEDAPRAVYADYLAERGDIFGEFIRLQLSDEDTRARTERVQHRYLKLHRTTFWPDHPIHAMAVPSVADIERGFPSRMALPHHGDDAARDAFLARWPHVAQLPGWSTVKVLSMAGAGEGAAKLLSAAGLPASVRPSDLDAAALVACADLDLPFESIGVALGADPLPYFSGWLELSALHVAAPRGHGLDDVVERVGPSGLFLRVSKLSIACTRNHVGVKDALALWEHVPKTIQEIELVSDSLRVHVTRSSVDGELVVAARLSRSEARSFIGGFPAEGEAPIRAVHVDLGQAAHDRDALQREIAEGIPFPVFFRAPQPSADQRLASGLTHDVYVSSGEPDAEEAARICDELGKRGLRAWSPWRDRRPALGQSIFWTPAVHRARALVYLHGSRIGADHDLGIRERAEARTRGIPEIDHSKGEDLDALAAKVRGAFERTETVRVWLFATSSDPRIRAELDAALTALSDEHHRRIRFELSLWGEPGVAPTSRDLPVVVLPAHVHAVFGSMREHLRLNPPGEADAWCLSDSSPRGPLVLLRADPTMDGLPFPERLTKVQRDTQLALELQIERYRLWGGDDSLDGYATTTLRAGLASLCERRHAPLPRRPRGLLFNFGMGSPAPSPASSVVDAIDGLSFAASAPAAIAPGSRFELRLQGHVRASPSARIRHACPLAFDVCVDVPSLGVCERGRIVCDDLPAEQSLFLAASESAGPGLHVGAVTFAAEGIPIGRMPIRLNIGDALPDIIPVDSRWQRFRRMYASYADGPNDAVAGWLRRAEELGAASFRRAPEARPELGPRRFDELASWDVFWLFVHGSTPLSEAMEQERAYAVAARGPSYVFRTAL